MNISSIGTYKLSYMLFRDQQNCPH